MEGRVENIVSCYVLRVVNAMMKKPNFIPYIWSNFYGFHSWIFNPNRIGVNWWLRSWFGILWKADCYSYRRIASNGHDSWVEGQNHWPPSHLGQEWVKSFLQEISGSSVAGVKMSQVWKIKGLEEKIKGNGKRYLLGKFLGRGTWQRQSRATWEQWPFCIRWFPHLLLSESRDLFFWDRVST